MRKLYETLLGVIENGLHPREVGMAVFLGVLAGFVTGFNLSLALVLLLAVVLAAPIRVFAKTWAFSVALAWLLTPASYRLGVQLLEHSSLGHWLRPHAHSVWVALFDLDRYALVGGAFLGALLGILVAGVATLVTRILQARYLRLVDRFVAHEDRLFRIAIRLACWLIFGSIGRPQPVRARPRTLRPIGVVAALVLILPCAIVTWYYAPHWTRSSLMNGLSVANQAEVEAADVELSLTDGLLVIEDLHIPNAADLDRDRMVLGRVLAEVKPGPLLRGQVLIERLLIDGIETNVARAEPARPCKLQFPAFDFSRGPRDGEGDGPSGGRPAFDIRLEDYVENWEHTRKRIEQFHELLQEIERLAGRGTTGADEDAGADAEPAGFEVPDSYREMWAARCTFGEPRPGVLVQSLRLKNPTAKWGLGEEAVLDVSNLSSNAPLTGQPTELKFAAPELGVALAATLNYHQPGTQHRLRMDAQQIALDELIRPDKLGNRWSLAGGRLDITAAGHFHAGKLDLPVTITASDLMLLVQGDDKIAGLSPDLWNQGLQKLQRFEFDAVVRGSILRPKLHVDTQALAVYFRDQLHAAGHAVLVAAIDRELNRGRVELDEAVAKGAAEAHRAVDAAANQANELADAAEAKLAGVEGKAHTSLDRAGNAVQATQDRAQQLTGKAAEEANSEVARGQQKAADWLAEQNIVYNPLAGALPGVQSVPESHGAQSASPHLQAAQGLIGRAAQSVQQQVSSRKQQLDQGVTSMGQQPGAAVESAREATQQNLEHAAEGVATVRSETVHLQGQMNATIEGAAQSIQQSANQASDQVRDAVASTSPQAMAVPMIPPAIVEGDVVPVDYPPEPPSETDARAAATSTDKAPAETADPPSVAEAPNSADATAAQEPLAASQAAEGEPAAAPGDESQPAERYPADVVARGWVPPYSVDSGGEVPNYRTSRSAAASAEPYPVDVSDKAQTPSASTSTVQGQPTAITGEAEHDAVQLDSDTPATIEQRSVRSTARSLARSRYASSRPYDARPYSTEEPPAHPYAANEDGRAKQAPQAQYRSQYDPLYQNDAAARPKSSAATNPDLLIESIEDRQPAQQDSSYSSLTRDTRSRAYGLQPGQRYSGDYSHASGSANLESGEGGENRMGTAAASDRRWSNVPLSDLPGESLHGVPSRAVVSRDPTPRELPVVEPPHPPDTPPASYGRTVRRERRGALFGPSSSEQPSAPSAQESGVISKLRQFWPFHRASGEDTASSDNNLPAVETVQRPEPPPSSVEFEMGSLPPAAGASDPGAAAGESKPWYRRLW